jgi:hypothetical protein
MEWVRMILEVIASEIVKLLDRPDTVLTDPEPELESVGTVSVDDVLARYSGLSD